MNSQNNKPVNYSERDMRMMALGEIGAFLLGPVVAVGAVLALDEYGFLWRLVAFLLAWHLATSAGLRIVHLGYVPEKHSGT